MEPIPVPPDEVKPDEIIIVEGVPHRCLFPPQFVSPNCVKIICRRYGLRVPLTLPADEPILVER